MRAAGVRGAVERYAKALDAVQQTRAQGLEAMPHQRVALDRARESLDAIRPHASTDLGAAFERQPELFREAAEGRSQAALKAMSKERSEEHTSELQSLMRISYAAFCLKKKIIHSLYLRM